MTTYPLRSRSIQISRIAGLAALILSGCENMPDALKAPQADGAQAPALAGGTLTLEERDVEAPEVFNATDDALWDGRPSFGGVWVAYPGNTQPERVSIRHVGNGKTVVGALFKREAENPGPAIRLSSDAAEALGVVAGEPTKLSITALRREPIEVASGATPAPAPEVLSETVLEPVTGPVEGTLAGTEATAATIEEALEDVQAPEPKPEVAAAAAPQAEAPAKPFIQVGTFSSEQNASDLVAKLTSSDVPAAVRSSVQDNGKTLYRVVAGPAASSDQLTQFLTKIKGLGFKDAFAISK